MRIGSTVIAMCLAAIAPAVVPAQDVPDSATTPGDTLTIAAGARVRADAYVNTCLRQTTIRGALVAPHRDTLIIAVDGSPDTTAVTLGQVGRLFVSEGRERGAQRTRWAVIGAAAGGVIAAVLRSAQCDVGEDCSPQGTQVAVGAIVGGALGFAAGSTREGERWRRVEIPPSLRGDRECPGQRAWKFP